MNGGPVPGRFGFITMATTILVAPFIALLIRVEAGLFVMALALAAGSFLLGEARNAAPVRIRPWLRLGVLVNLTLAAACVVFAAWLLAR